MPEKFIAMYINGEIAVLKFKPLKEILEFKGKHTKIIRAIKTGVIKKLNT